MGIGSTAAELHAGLVEELRKSGRITTPEVADAFAAVPRHLFVPGIPLKEAYRDDAVFTKRAPDGTPLSSVSAPWLVATMLERLDAAPGDRVLEIGSGGYNAALLSRIVGEKGEVTSLDIDPEVIDRAESALRSAGVDEVRLLTGDGTLAVPDGGPYDRTVVTVQATSIALAWLEQLTADGRLVVPLRLRGLGRLLTFVRAGDHWVGDGWDLCGFVRMRGPAALDPMATTPLGEGVRLRWDGGPPPDADALTTALVGERHEVWTGVTVGVTEGTRPVVDLWLATVLDVFGRLHTTGTAPAGVRALPGGSPATWDGTGLAHLTMRPADPGASRFEYGVVRYGGDASTAVEFAHQLRIWDRDHRDGPGPVLRIFPRGGPECAARVCRLLDRPGPAMVLAWP
ncbi:methyltransferase, FxLD system [Streptomyces sp. NPDC020875]|uniref:methyltransferase, FxLD system n=1 Tax=Streptomyces sp. NPDC020875 TaxID=3154898 RepID=UPI0033E12CE5